jgi:large repetitive protein
MTYRQVQMNTRPIFTSIIILQVLAVPLWADWAACVIGANGNIGVQIQTSATHPSPGSLSAREWGANVPSKSENSDGSLNFTLSAEGAPLGDKTDSFGFASAPVKMHGDGEIVVQVTKISPGKQDWAAGGVMLRENFRGGSQFFAAAFTRGHGIQNFMRIEDSAAVATHENCSDCKPPSWLKIVRRGNHFTSFKSMDGRVWLEISEADVPMKMNVWAGVFTTSGGGAPAAGVTFAHVVTRENTGQ